MSNALYGSSSASASSGNFIQNTLQGVGGSWNFPGLTDWVIGVNYAVLAVCVVVSGLLLMDFFIRYFKMTAQDDFLSNHLLAKKHFFQSFNTWTTYLPLLALLYLYANFASVSPWNIIIAIAFFITAVIKIVWEYSKTPVSKVLSGDDESIIGRFFKSLQGVTGGGKSKDKKGNGSVVEFTGGILGEVASQVGGLGREALRQTTGINVQDQGGEKKK